MRKCKGKIKIKTKTKTGHYFSKWGDVNVVMGLFSES
jgi:hypothetical protein